MTDTEIYGNTWAVIPHGSMLVFLIIIIIVIYYLGFYFGIQMEKTAWSAKQKMGKWTGLGRNSIPTVNWRHIPKIKWVHLLRLM